MEQKLHTPEGVRDIYNKECETKLTLQRKLNKVLHLYGYQDIQTPTFEYYEVFRKEIGSTSTQELYKFFDREGNILALRPDITPSVARAAATLFESEDMPIRLCYAGNTFINHSSYQGRLKENTQLGAELIGLDSVEADAEMLAMVVDSLKQVGLEEFQVSLGHVDFIQSLLKAAGLEEDENREIRTLITNRNFFGVEEILDAHQVKESVREAFRLLPELTGGPEVLELAMGAAPDLDARLAVTRLQQIFRLLKLYGADDHITFDLSMIGNYGYYTGIIFRGYTYGTGDAIGKGGRYDNLLMQFGKNAPAIGFTILVDEMLSALDRQNIPVSLNAFAYSVLLYERKDMAEAIGFAMELRSGGQKVECICMKEKDRAGEYISFAKQQGAENIFVLDGDALLIHDFSTGRIIKTGLKDFRREY